MPSSAKDNKRWLEEFRQQLLAYYKSQTEYYPKLSISTQSVVFMAAQQLIGTGYEVEPRLKTLIESFDVHQNTVSPSYTEILSSLRENLS